MYISDSLKSFEVLNCLLPRTIQFIGLTYVQEINHEYIYQIIAVRDSVPITYFHKSNFHVETTY